MARRDRNGPARAIPTPSWRPRPRIDFVDVDEDVLRRRVEDGGVFAEAAGLALGGLFDAAHLTVLRDLDPAVARPAERPGPDHQVAVPTGGGPGE